MRATLLARLAARRRHAARGRGHRTGLSARQTAQPAPCLKARPKRRLLQPLQTSCRTRSGPPAAAAACLDAASGL